MDNVSFPFTSISATDCSQSARFTEAYLTLDHIGFNSESPIWYKDPHLHSLSSSYWEHLKNRLTSKLATNSSKDE